MYKSAHGEWVLHSEAQDKIDALKAENKRLQEKCEHSAIARFNWRTKYLTLATSALLILGLDESTSRDEIINAVGALKAQCDELLAVAQNVVDAHASTTHAIIAPSSEAFSRAVLDRQNHRDTAIYRLREAIANARGESV